MNMKKIIIFLIFGLLFSQENNVKDPDLKDTDLHVEQHAKDHMYVLERIENILKNQKDILKFLGKLSQKVVFLENQNKKLIVEEYAKDHTYDLESIENILEERGEASKFLEDFNERMEILEKENAGLKKRMEILEGNK